MNVVGAAEPLRRNWADWFPEEARHALRHRGRAPGSRSLRPRRPSVSGRANDQLGDYSLACQVAADWARRALAAAVAVSPVGTPAIRRAAPAALPEFFGMLHPSFRRAAASFEGSTQFFAQLGGCQDQNIVPGSQSGVTFDGDKLAVPHNEADPSVAWEVG